MLLKKIDEKIRHAFSNAAIQYDVLTGLHQEIGRELVKKIVDTDNTRTILDIGMGTGRLTRRLKFYFPESSVIGMDFADGMIAQARKKSEGIPIHILKADANALPLRAQSLDLVVSNLALQWVEDLPHLFQDVHRLLKPGGSLKCTLFGYRTFQELFESLECVSARRRRTFGVRRLADSEEIKKSLLTAGFYPVDVQYELIHVHFPTMIDLMRWIKNIGANVLPREVFIGKELIAGASHYYNEHFKDRYGVRSTFEVIWVAAGK